jgi:predicted permease
MPLLVRAASFLRNVLSFRRKDEDLDQEIDSHLGMLIDENLRAGMPAKEARRAALIELGGAEQVKEQVREVRIGHWLHSVVSDCRYGLRQLRKTPGFTAAAVVTLAMAIGANAVVFGVWNRMILRPLNVPQAQSLYGLERRGSDGFQSYPDYLDLRDRNRSFDRLAAYNITQVGLDTGENASRIWVYEVSGNYFDALGIQPYLGRLIHPSDEHGPNSAPYIVLTYAFWHTRFQDDRGVVGRVVQVNKHPFTIVGVTPPGFQGTLLFFSPAFFVPIVNQYQDANALRARGSRWIFEVIGHLKEGVAPQKAAADLDSIGFYLEKTYPKDDGQMSFVLVRPSLYGDYAGRPVRAFMTGLMLLAGLILLAACANLGSLFAARAADRSREVALRLALGARPCRVLRQLFTEAILISLIGGAVGLLGGIWLLRGLSAWQPFSRYPVHMVVNPDAYVYGVVLLLSLASGFLFGAVPVRQILHTDPYQIVKAGSIVGVGRRMALRDMLVVGQIAICAVLVISSMVALRGLVRSLHSKFGFEPLNAVLISTDLNMAGYRGDNVSAMQKRMIDAMEAIPGVESVGLIDEPPLRECCNTSTVFPDQATDLRDSRAAAKALIYNISPEYLQAAGTALLSGRTFSWHDDRSAPRVAVVNREFASKVFGSPTNAVGRYYKMPDGARIQVVGIAEDGKYNSLTEDPQAAMFLPILQSPTSGTSLVVRSNGDLGQLVTAIRSSLRGLDTGLPLYIAPWNKELDTALFPSRLATMALGVMGVIGAMLTITGIFGMAAYSVSKRLRELGIRIALGAQWKEVLQAALGRALKLLTLGSAAGLLLGILASRLLAFIVYQATPGDPLVLVGTVLAMLLLGLVATWIPAQRALSIDPIILLREE